MNNYKLKLNEFDKAVSSFCLNILHQRTNCDVLVTSLIGEDLEWCGAHSFLLLANNYNKIKDNVTIYEKRCNYVENLLNNEKILNHSLTKQIKEIQLTSQDNEWQLQEQIAQITNSLSIEIDNNNDLKNKLLVAESKLIEVEMYLTSEKGLITLQLEQDLALSKLKIAELEADKDSLELEVRQLKEILDKRQ